MDENAGKTEEEIRCSGNGGFALTAAKGVQYEKRYVEPVRRFPTHCTSRLEELLGRRKGSMKVLLFGHGWGGVLAMMSLQTAPDFAGPDSRIVAAVTAGMSLDSNEFEWDLVTQGATFLTSLHKKARWLPKNLAVQIGITWRDTFLEGIDPDSKLRSAPCPEVEKNEQRKISLSWGEAGYKVVDAVLEPKPGAYATAVPTLHVYCDQDKVIVPDYIRRAAFSQNINPAVPVCVVDVAKYGKCSHVSFPGRTTAWDEKNTPWHVFKTWLSTANATTNSTADVFSSCPLGTLKAAEAIQLTTTAAPL
jgi:pimeloyl-ACP methyl ester carboxylesterase